MKIYTYSPKEYNIKVTVPSVFSVFIFLVCIYEIIFTANKTIFALVGFISLYTFWDAFGSISNPSQVKISSQFLSFTAYGREHQYSLEDITSFKIKEFRYSGKMYIRINKSNRLRGRYWLNTKEFNDGDELFRYMIDLEYHVHPNSLKAIARNTNQI